MNISRLPKSVLLTGALIAVDSVFWLLFAVLAAISRSYLASLPVLFKWVTILLALLCSLVLAGISLLVIKRSRLGFYLGLLVLTVVATLSLLDEAGFLDLLSFFLSLLPLLLLLRDRAWYLNPQADQVRPPQGSEA